MHPGMWIAEVPILSDTPLVSFKSFGGWKEVHRSGWLWKHAPSLGFLTRCCISFQAHVCLYPLDDNFIQRPNSWQGSPDGTKRRLCLACGALGQHLDHTNIQDEWQAKITGSTTYHFDTWQNYLSPHIITSFTGIGKCCMTKMIWTASPHIHSCGELVILCKLHTSHIIFWQINTRKLSNSFTNTNTNHIYIVPICGATLNTYSVMHMQCVSFLWLDCAFIRVNPLLYANLQTFWFFSLLFRFLRSNYGY